MKVGRPPHSRQEIEQAKPLLLSILRTIGYRAGKGTMELKLPEMPRRVISTALRVIKAEHKAEEARRWEENRIHVEVLAMWAVLTQDSTHIGNCNGRKVWAEVNKDAATTWAEANGDGKVITGDAMLEHLEYLWSQGMLPLVLATDNGSAYKDHRVALCLHKHQVIHLFSRPHTPQDNGRAECGIGEGKALAGLGTGVRLQNPAKGVSQLDKALQTLNQHWPRQTKGGLTAAQLAQKLPHWKDITKRSTFYEAAYSAILNVKAGTKREQRLETREAIFRTLERFGLIRRTRGERKDTLGE
jgi:transposase InsO family protein